jgi:hypothetical protein
MSSGKISAGISGEIKIKKAYCCQILATNLTQHDSHGPDDHSRSISRVDGMDEHGNAWLCGCHLVGFWLESGAIKIKKAVVVKS